MRPILECQRLTKKYGSFFALSNLNLSIERGQIVEAVRRLVREDREKNER